MVIRFAIFCLGICFAVPGIAQSSQQSGLDNDALANKYQSMIDQYCVSCHNAAMKTAGIVLENANVGNIADNPQLWERVYTKLSLRAMPPVGLPRPQGGILYEEFFTYLQNELDSASAKSMNPGSKTAHRLNRTEYANAIRDLLLLEINSEELLPSDNIGQGFDNIADVLAVSPVLMERYMLAADQISRLAVPPPSMEPDSETYTVSEDMLQRSRMSDELPVGSRGGIAIHHNFPLDGEYAVSVTLNRNLEGYIRGLREKHMLDIRLDYKSVGMLEIGGEVHGNSGPIFTDKQTAEYAGEAEQVGYEFTADRKLNIRFPAKAGSHVLGITFMDVSTKPTGIRKPDLRLVETVQFKGGAPAIESVTLTGPYDATGPGQTETRGKVFVCYPDSSTSNLEQESCAKTITARLLRQAYRRPVAEVEVDELLEVFRIGRDDGGFEDGIRLVLQSILASPDFLFRIEKDPPGLAAGSVYQVNDVEMASRLSFFLWSSIPDETLLQLAEQGKLSKPDVLAQQVQRMIQDPRFDTFIYNFGRQWLAVRDVELKAPNLDLFPEFDGELREAFKQEMLTWFESMVREDKSIFELLTSDYTYVNERLADHYGIPGVKGTQFKRVNLAGYEMRKGLLGKGGFLMATAYNNRTSPVLRGKWVLENLLNMPPPPPPENVPALEVTKGGKSLTLKQAMEQHRANPVCSACHKLMDPIGFALENFDAVGSYRTMYADANAEVDASGILFDGNEFKSTDQFRSYFLKHSERVVHTVTEKVLTYALGRGLEYYDQPTVRQIVRNIAADDYVWSSLILAVIKSTPFQNRRVSSHDNL
jgi:hypothetical protein